MSFVGANEPLKLADGTLVFPGGKIVDPNERKTPKYIEVPTNREAQQLVVNTRRRIADLPDIPKTMNVISVVLSYSLFGLDATEIALATGLTEGQVTNLKESEAFKTMHDTVVNGILASETDSIKDVFVKNARNAAQELVSGLSSGSRGDRMMAASQILDRGGFRPADIVEHRHRMEGGLQIEIIKRDETKQVPTIDLSLES